MTPLVLLYYERLFPGTHLVNRMQDLGYRVLTHSQVGTLVARVEQEKPLLLVADLGVHAPLVCAALERLRRSPETAHLPIVALMPPRDKDAQALARTAGATLVVLDRAILLHLEQFLEQALHLE